MKCHQLVLGPTEHEDLAVARPTLTIPWISFQMRQRIISLHYLEHKVLSLQMTAPTLTAYILASDLYMAEVATNVMPPGSKQRAKVDLRSVISVKSISLSGTSHTS